MKFAEITGRLEDQRLVTGHGRYVSDWNFPGQAYAVFLRADRAHAVIRRIDAQAALASPGVLAVLTAEDIRKAGYTRIPCNSPGPGRDGREMAAVGKTLLADGRVRFVGEAVACVIAESTALAQDATELIEIDYEDLPVVTTAEQARAPGAPQLHPEVPGNLVLDYEVGDAAKTTAAFAAAARVVSVTIDNPRQVCNPMEPRGCTATWSADTDHYTLYCPSQGVNQQRGFLSRITGLPDDKLDVVAMDVGGGFGVRSSMYPEYVVALLAAKTIGRAVKWHGTRSEVFLADDQARDTLATGEVAIDANGRFTAMRFHFTSNIGAFSAINGAFVPTKSTLACMTGVYDLTATCGRVQLLLTNTAPTAAYRGAGRPVMSYILERLVDEAAVALGMDAAELRRRNLVKKEQMPYTTAHGAVYDSGEFEAVLSKALQHADWQGFVARRAASAARGKLRGRGIATFIEATAIGAAGNDEVIMKFDADGNLIVYVAPQSQGQGHETTFAQVIAGTLGIPVERVLLRAGAAGLRVRGNAAGGSRSMLGIGSVSHKTSLAVIEKGQALAATALEAPASDIEFKLNEAGKGEYCIAGTDRRIALMDLIQRHAGSSPHPLDTTGEGHVGVTYPNSCHIAEVEIDPDTGITTIASYSGVDDIGNIINHQLVEGQIHGGMAQGAGHVFGEQAVYDEETGQLLTGSFQDYPMPRAELLPVPRLEEHTVPTPTNPLGAKGVGESGVTGSVPTLTSAVMDALRQAGVTHFDLPATPQRVWRAIVEARAGNPRALAVNPAAVTA
jgi:carbon-monoxide dehydrogenase large subunit